MNLFDKESLYRIVKINEENDVFEKIIYNFLAINKDFILENTEEFTIDDLWYSEYYWLHRLKEKKNKYDAGVDE